MVAVVLTASLVPAASAAERPEGPARREGRERRERPERRPGEPARRGQPGLALGERLFDALDVNKNGQVDREEFLDGMVRLRGRLRRQMPGPPDSEAPARLPGPEELERRVHEMVERQMRELLERHLPEKIEQLAHQILDRELPERVRDIVRDTRRQIRENWRSQPQEMPGRWHRWRQERAWPFSPPGQESGEPRPEGWWPRGSGGGGPMAAPPGDGPRRRGPRLPGRASPRRGAAEPPLFGGLDADGDGKLQATELKRVAGMLSAVLRESGGRDLTPRQWARITRKLRDQPRELKAGPPTQKPDAQKGPEAQPAPERKGGPKQQAGPKQQPRPKPPKRSKTDPARPPGHDQTG